MSNDFHAIVWIDHVAAKIFPLDAPHLERAVISSKAAGHHLRHKAHVPGSGHQGVDKEYFVRVIDALGAYGSVLLTGPGHTRLELKNFIDDHRPDFARRIAAVEPLDHPSDAELVALGRKHFEAHGHLHPHGAP